MQLAPSDIYRYYRPTECALRVYLSHRGEPEAPPGPYHQVLFRLADRHEKTHLATFPTVSDLSLVEWEARAERTKEAVLSLAPVIYQGALRAAVAFNGVECEVVGIPDFLLNVDDNYVIRDSKISRRINEDDHPEILRQLELYGWLYEITFGRAPIRLEVHSGNGDIVAVPYDGGRAVRNLLTQIVKVKLADAEPDEAVGWTKCEECGFFDRCWRMAEANQDVALVKGIDQSLARTLHERGVRTIGDLLGRFDQAQLAAFKRPWGSRLQRVGASATDILLHGRALRDRKAIPRARPTIPDSANFAMFDLEGLPPHLDEIQKIYLWGLQVYGEDPNTYRAATAGFGVEGDRQGWEDLLQIASALFQHYGDLPFVHWSHYERTNLDMYIKRYGDRDGLAARIRQNSYDLLPITQHAVVLPLPSYGLKAVEGYVGFVRTLPHVSGDWAMAKYIEAIETEDPEQRTATMEQILAYNQEDLAAMWTVLKWLMDSRL